MSEQETECEDNDWISPALRRCALTAAVSKEFWSLVPMADLLRCWARAGAEIGRSRMSRCLRRANPTASSCVEESCGAAPGFRRSSIGSEFIASHLDASVLVKRALAG